MRCPKCHYISFDSADRCRNCGYEFALAADTGARDLPIRTGDEAFGPLADFLISDVAEPGPLLPSRNSAGPDRAAPMPPAAAAPRPITSVFDLPLFKDRPADDDRPLVVPAAVPRQPLSVRRSSPVPPRAARALNDEATLDLDALEPDAPPLRHVPWLPKTELRRRTVPEPVPEAYDTERAGLFARLFAAVVDGAILGSICGAVLYITLEVCGLRFDQLRLLPIPPLAAFLLLLIGGYYVLLTAASGQTLGKMAAGIRVVPMQPGERVSLGHSTVRAVGYLVSLLPAGLGLVPALVHGDGRALHDRLADTRVVKA
jgi:uncharacterized RDD family membrane protein YckC